MKNWFTIKNEAGEECAEITIFDEIGYWGANAKDFYNELKDIPKDRNIKLRISSPGGSVVEGMAIYNFLKERSEHVTAQVDAMAASIASVIIMAASKIVMPANTTAFIHAPWDIEIGNAAQMRKAADDLDKFGGQIADIYANRTGQSREEIDRIMAEETLLTAAEAKELGFCDEVTDEVAISASCSLKNAHSKVRDHLKKFAATSSRIASGDNPDTKNKTKIMKQVMNALVSAGLLPSAEIEDGEAARLLGEALATRETAANASTERVEQLENELNESKEASASAAVQAAVDAKTIADNDSTRAFWAKAYREDPEGTQAQFKELSDSRKQAAPKAGAEPLKGEGNEPDSLESVRAALAKETNPVKKTELARQARALRNN